MRWTAPNRWAESQVRSGLDSAWLQGSHPRTQLVGFRELMIVELRLSCSAAFETASLAGAAADRFVEPRNPACGPVVEQQLEITKRPALTAE